MVSYGEFISFKVKRGDTRAADLVKMCPLECVVIVVCCWHSKRSKQEVKSLVRGRLILSKWMLKSPSSIMFGEREDRWVRKEAKSIKKSLFGLVGR